MNMETRMPAAPSAATMGLQAVVLAGRVDAALGGALLALLRHDAGGMRPGLERDGQHLVGRRHFQIERNLQRLATGARYRHRRYAGGLRADAR